MRSRTLRLSIVLCGSLFSIGVGAQENNEVDSAGLADDPKVAGALAVVDAWIDGLRDYRKIPGLSVGVVVDQELIFAKGYGVSNLRTKRPADIDTIYSICSISKVFTSIGVMQQRDRGKLTLRDPIHQHLAWLPIQAAHGKYGPARVQGLLTHSSGLPREVDFSYWVERDFGFPDRQQMIARLRQQSTLYPADTYFQYSNLGLTLAGEILSTVSGLTYQEYVEQEILQPLNMGDTRPFLPADLHGKQMAVGYSGQNRSLRRDKVAPFDARAMSPAFGFTSNVSDLAKFASWQFRILGEAAFNKDESARSSQVLSGNTLREMHRVHWVDPDWTTTWGIGFAVRETKGVSQVGHGGACPGYITAFQMIPSAQLGVIVLTNAGDGPAGAIAQNMLATLAPVLKGAKKAAKPKPPTTDLSEYAGNFGGSVWGGETAIRVWDDKLVVVSLPSSKIGELPKLKQVKGDLFVRLAKDGSEREQWLFGRDDAGSITHLVRHSQNYQKLN